MSHSFKIFFVATLFISLFVSEANAQSEMYETRQYSLSRDKVFDLPPPSEIKKEFLQEMDQVHKTCSADYKDSGHRDCKCYAMTFLEQRLKLQNVRQSIITTAIHGECFDLEKMQGFYFGKCAGKIKLELCDCR